MHMLETPLSLIVVTHCCCCIELVSACHCQGVSGQVKDRMEMAAAGQLPASTRPLLLFPEVLSGTTSERKACNLAGKK